MWRPKLPVWVDRVVGWRTGKTGLDNELFYMDKTMMVFGDAKKVVEDMVKAVE